MIRKNISEDLFIFFDIVTQEASLFKSNNDEEITVLFKDFEKAIEAYNQIKKGEW